MKRKFLAFIGYEDTTGLHYAKHLKRALARIRVSAFVAAVDIHTGEDWVTVRDGALTHCKYFVPIITLLALSSENVKKEFKTAELFGKIIIPCKKSEIARSQLTVLSPVINRLQQINYDSKEDLAESMVTELFRRENILTVFPSRDLSHHLSMGLKMIYKGEFAEIADKAFAVICVPKRFDTEVFTAGITKESILPPPPSYAFHCEGNLIGDMIGFIRSFRNLILRETRKYQHPAKTRFNDVLETAQASGSPHGDSSRELIEAFKRLRLSSPAGTNLDCRVILDAPSTVSASQIRQFNRVLQYVRQSVTVNFRVLMVVRGEFTDARIPIYVLNFDSIVEAVHASIQGRVDKPLLSRILLKCSGSPTRISAYLKQKKNTSLHTRRP